MMCLKERSITKIGKATYEEVTEATEVDAAPHQFSENVGKMCLAGNRQRA
jgi:hypothetical protein